MKLNIKDLQESSFLTIPLQTDFQFVDNQQGIIDTYLEQATQDNINSQIDFDKTKISPQTDSLLFSLKRQNGTQLFYSDLGFTNGDIIFEKRAFKKSFLKLNFYDSPNQTNQKLIAQSFYYTQIENIQRDDNSIPLDVNLMPVSFRVSKTPNLLSKIRENYSIHVPNWFNFTKPLWCYLTYNNAKTGQVINLQANPIIVSTSTMNQYNTLKYTISGDQYIIDTTDRDVAIIGDTTEISLYKTYIL